MATENIQPRSLATAGSTKQTFQYTNNTAGHIYLTGTNSLTTEKTKRERELEASNDSLRKDLQRATVDLEHLIQTNLILIKENEELQELADKWLQISKPVDGEALRFLDKQ